MLIGGHPDFLILPLTGLSARRNRKLKSQPEVQGLWETIVNKSKD